ncbi:glycosyltransferase family 4 protein [Hoeflea sp. YIM 152468]|uniref:glycosyltransferase family 4 protein n=1 Tax=Hoeflea sp. YIM 152468 TaxID=3031759 RepID=UPI0023DC8F41|nr:glycosyltransferase family 4 protein [Hoeflea sp. YIM 152468]MDF1609647.1 glycosyltransferase family 4 protein [Hoeflea sp. YIM 152468]
MSARIDMGDVEVVAPNLKRRLSGVTSTVIQLVPEQRRQGVGIAVLGPGLPDDLPRISWFQLPGLLVRPRRRRFRIWHARRNTEMLAGLVLRHVFRAPLRLVFTSAAQRHHTGYTRWLMRRMDRIVTTSSRSAAFLQLPHVIIPHGVDLDRFHPPSDAERDWSTSGLPGRYGLGCFGRIRAQKGTDLLVDALISLLPRYPEWTAAIFGRTTAHNQGFTDALKARIEASGLSSRIVFMGEVADVKPWLRRVTLCVAPSRNEGFGLTPLEAMASQTAVVASDAGAYRDLVEDDVTGQVVPAGDGDALTQAIETYLADPGRAEAHGRAGLERARSRFGLAGEARALSEVYEELWAQR